MKISLFPNVKILCLATVVALVPAIGSAEPHKDSREEGFRQPPNSAKPQVYWQWINGNVTKEGITADLEAMHRVGINGVLVQTVGGGPRGPMQQMNPQFFDMMEQAAREAARLGMTMNMVKVNGQDLGILWKPPFRVDIGPAARAVINRLEIEVTNLWPNRLIGDEQLPADVRWGRGDPQSGWGLDWTQPWPQWLVEGKPSPTGRLTFATWRHYSKDSPLLPSGLLGPVLLISAERRTYP